MSLNLSCSLIRDVIWEYQKIVLGHDDVFLEGANDVKGDDPLPWLHEVDLVSHSLDDSHTLKPGNCGKRGRTESRVVSQHTHGVRGVDRTYQQTHKDLRARWSGLGERRDDKGLAVLNNLSSEEGGRHDSKSS